jgi:hypothetical protein
MNSLDKSMTCSNLRKRLENAYDQKQLDKAIELGDIIDEMQSLLLLKEQEKTA